MENYQYITQARALSQITPFTHETQAGEIWLLLYLNLKFLTKVAVLYLPVFQLSHVVSLSYAFQIRDIQLGPYLCKSHLSETLTM